MSVSRDLLDSSGGLNYLKLNFGGKSVACLVLLGRAVQSWKELGAVGEETTKVCVHRTCPGRPVVGG